MSGHLLLMSIGPVQEFIMQARRMRDLWFGSHVLSEVSKAAAKELASRGARLIFPALDAGDGKLAPCNELYHHDGTPAFNVANKLLALIPDGEPATVADHAAEQARKRFVDWGLCTLESCEELVDPEAKAGAREQLDTLLRIDAVWTAWDDSSQESYKDARQALEHELAGRKTLVRFAPWRRQRGGVHKSSLDGGRETVLRQDGRDSDAWRQYRIGRREQLDAVGLLKRAGGIPGQFVPVPTVGLVAWLDAANHKRPSEMDALRKQCSTQRFFGVSKEKQAFQAFPFDAQIFLPERWEPYLKEYGKNASEAAAFGREYIQKLLDHLRKPYPYIACIVADGDRMGNAIDVLAAEGPERHRQFSRQLSGFATRAREIVERHRGILIYSGGDDVIAFVCVQEALACADELRITFGNIVSEALGNADIPTPTLSVGIGVGHILQSLGRLLTLGRDAEKHAKTAEKSAKNMLAILFERHSGAVRTWHKSWDHTPVTWLNEAADLLDTDRLSSKKVYQLHELAQRMPEQATGNSEGFRALLCGEAQRILARTQLGERNEALSLAEAKLTFKDDYSAVRAELAHWVGGMQIAMELVRARRSVRHDASPEGQP